MVIYTNLMPERFDGWTIGPVTLIRPSHRDHYPLHAHEEVHRAQFWRNPFKACLYLFSGKVKLAMELEAYSAQVAAGGNANDCANALASLYGFDLTPTEALTLLTNH